MVRFLADASLHHAIVTGCARREPAIARRLIRIEAVKGHPASRSWS
jgi:hypothetical protein